MERKGYEKELRKLQVELLPLAGVGQSQRRAHHHRVRGVLKWFVARFKQSFLPCDIGAL